MPPSIPQLISNQRHYVVITMPAWGHARPEISLSLRLLQLHSHLLMTLALPSFISDRTTPELAKFRLSSEQRGRLRVIQYDAIKDPPPDPNMSQRDDGALLMFSEWMGELVEPVYEGILKRSAICDSPDELPFDRPPDVVFVDIMVLLGFRPRLHRLTEAAGAHMPKILRMGPFSLAYNMFLTDEDNSPLPGAIIGYLKDVDGGVDRMEAYDKWIGDTDELVRLPGLGPMSLFEMDCNATEHFSKHMTTFNSLVKDAQKSGTVIFWPSLPDLAERFSSKYEYHTVGPQLPTAADNTTGFQQEADEVIDFLDRCLQRDGAHSVLYICFGSLHLPPTPSQADLLFDAIEKAGLRVLFGGRVSDPDLVGQEGRGEETTRVIHERIARMGALGMMSPWTPQLRVLQHEAIAFFMNHGGSNSATEGLICGVPMVIWPNGWDQGFTGNELSMLGVAFELIQPRTGIKRGKRTARGVVIEGTDEAFAQELSGIIGQLRGPKGDEMRQRAREVKELVLEDMRAGRSHQTMLDLGHLVG